MTATATLPHGFASSASSVGAPLHHDSAFALDSLDSLDSLDALGRVPSPSDSITSVTNITNITKKMRTAPGMARQPSRADANGSTETTSASAADAGTLYRNSNNSNNSNNKAQESADDGINPLKRRNTDVGGSIDYPRRRATIACEVCRSRKSRCDGTRPKCKLCTELGAECIYREPGIKLDAGDKLILERLGRIEEMLQRSLAAGHSTGLAVAGGHIALDGLGPAGASMWTEQTAAAATAAASGVVSVIPAGGIGTWTSGTNISTMPKVHTNAALHLLQWPMIRDLVSRPYDPQSMLQLEMAREPLHSLAKTPCVDLSNTAAYIEAYFDHVNMWYACVNPYTWRSHYRIALSNGFREGPESCIVLLVLALGQASLRGSISRIVPSQDPPGLQYFTAAWALLPGMMTSNSVLAAQCHLLAAAYLFYLVRPLEAWNLLCTTSTKLQLLLMSPNRVPPEQRELTERIYWNALLSESDLLAELDLPHSGIVQFEENVGLPCGFKVEGDDDEQQQQQAVGRDDLWYFLAEIALRRLLNRVSQLIYSKDSSIASTTSLEPVVTELDYQLTQWYESLPTALQFPFSRTLLADPVQTVLRLRFFACRTIIYRPYILAVLDSEQAGLDPAGLDPAVQDNCRKCLEAAVRQLEHITAHHAGHMPYLWQGALSIVSQTLLVMGASMSPTLSSILLTIVPHRNALDQMISNAIAEIELYSSLAPSLKLAAEIIQEAEARRRAYLNG